MTKQKKVAKARKPVEVPEEIAEETAAVKSPEQDVDVEEETTSAPIPSKQSKQASKAAAGEKSSSSSSSTSSSSSSSSSNSSTETDNETAIVEGGDERLEEENSLEVHKKPVPVRRPSVIKATQNGETLPASTPAAPAIQIPEESPPHIMDHCYAKPSSEKRPPAQRNTFENQFANDHGYTRPRTPPRGGEPGDDDVFDTVPAPPPTESKVSVAKAPANRAKAGRKPSATKETKATSKKALAKAVGANRAAAAAAVAVPQRVKSYPMRAMPEEYNVLFKFLTNGLDLEDINFLKRSYDRMLNDSQHDDRLYYLNDTHWVDHSITEIPDPPKKKRKDDFSRAHTTGSCRTEGYYKMDPREKARTKYHLHRSDADVFDQFRLANYEGSATKGKIQTAQSLSREARNNQRRQLAVLGDEVLNSDLLKFNQLKVKKRTNVLFVISHGHLYHVSVFLFSSSSVGSR